MKEKLASAKIDSSFQNEDTTPVTQDELRGFYSFAVATEAYAGIAVAVFWPIILKDLSAKEAFNSADLQNGVMSACSTTGKYVCEIPVFGNYIDTSSLVLLAQSFSVLVQFFLFIALGSLADYGNHRKSMMILLTNATALIGICVLFVIDSSVWYLAFMIYVLSNIAFGASHVFNYAWIPILTRYSQEVVEARDDPLVSDEEYFVVSDKVGNEISTKGLFYGYISSLVQIIIAVVFAYFVKAKMIGLTSTYPLQICIAAICAFMFLMTTFYTSKMVKSRPGPPMNPNTNFAVQSYKNLWATLKRAKELSQLFLFLGAWFIYSDAFSTLVNIAILFSQSELGAPLELLLIATIIFPIAAGMGNYFWLGVQKKFKFSTKAMICIQCGFYGLIPLYGLIGFFVPEGSMIGLSNKYELPFVAFLHGFMLAATLSSCRVLFSELLPKGHEGEFFGLYEITDKGSSWVGPLIVALITQWTGSLRYSFLFIFASFLIPMWMFSMVDVLKGKEQAHNYHEKYDPHK